jgi:hypothetical protein
MWDNVIKRCAERRFTYEKWLSERFTSATCKNVENRLKVVPNQAVYQAERERIDWPVISGAPFTSRILPQMARR